jgi:hypothetical protein
MNVVCWVHSHPLIFKILYTINCEMVWMMIEKKCKCITSLALNAVWNLRKNFQSNVRFNQTAWKFKQINLDFTGVHIWICGILETLTFCGINIFPLLPIWFLFHWHIGSIANKELSLYRFSLYLHDVCNQFYKIISVHMLLESG